MTHSIPVRADGTPYPTRTTRMFGRCWGKRCRTRAVVEVTVYTQGGRDVVVDREKVDAAERTAFVAGCCPDGKPVMNGMNTEHGVMTWKGLNGRYDATVACGPRCTDATGADCKCECGGEFHGTSA